MNQAYLSLAGRIRADLLDLERLAARILHIWQQAAESAYDYYVDAVALNLHSFYSGIERTLELIADVVDQTKPSGARWHDELLRQMAAEMPGVRPAVLSLQARDQFDRFRGFRHVVRNVYAFSLDPDLIGVLIQHLPSAMETVSQELGAFADFLEQVAED